MTATEVLDTIAALGPVALIGVAMILLAIKDAGEGKVRRWD